MKKLILFSLMSVLLLMSLGACSESSGLSDEEKTAKSKMEEGIAYFNDEFDKALPDLAGKKDTEGMISELESAIAKSEEYVNIYMDYMDNDNLSASFKEAAMNLKTAFYGIQTTALEPLLEIFKTDSGDAPDYKNLVSNAKENYVDPAEKLLK